MRTRHIGSVGRVALVAAAAFLVLASSACEPSVPTLPSPEKEAAPPAPRPVNPVNNALAGRQNDPTTACPPTDASRGAGLRVDFEWEAVPGAVAYLGCFWHDGGEALVCPEPQYPYRLQYGSFHTAESRVSVVQCGFVQDFVLTDWHWKVAARTDASGWGPYSPPMTFTFTACRLSDGRPCFAP